MEKYSVLMSVYHKEKAIYLEEAIESMLNQTVTPDEIVLVEDGVLTDELYDVINRFVTEYPDLFKILKNKSNLGLGLSLNKGLEGCRNELVARMDTDDISKLNRCEKQLELFNKKAHLSIVGSHIDEFYETINNITSKRKVPITSDEIYEFSKRRSAFNHPVVMYRKSSVLSVGGYRNYKRNQDVDLFGRMLYYGFKGENINESLLYFRSSDELYVRRKSWENTFSYIKTIKNFWKMGYSTYKDFIVVLISQIIIYFLPIKFQKFIYNKFLRRGSLR